MLAFNHFSHIRKSISLCRFFCTPAWSGYFHEVGKMERWQESFVEYSSTCRLYPAPPLAPTQNLLGKPLSGDTFPCFFPNHPPAAVAVHNSTRVVLISFQLSIISPHSSFPIAILRLGPLRLPGTCGTVAEMCDCMGRKKKNSSENTLESCCLCLFSVHLVAAKKRI